MAAMTSLFSIVPLLLVSYLATTGSPSSTSVTMIVTMMLSLAPSGSVAVTVTM